MAVDKKIVYPYMPNSAPDIKKAMMDELKIGSIEDLYRYIPENLRFKGSLNLPEPLLSEIELKNHVDGILSKNKSSAEYISFLGAGCYRHYIPAICDEINSRSEFLTAYCGGTYTDHGKCQAIFEFTSLMGELLDMDVVGLPTYDGAQAASTAVRMANRLTGKNEILVPKTMNPEIFSHMKNYSDFMNITTIEYDEQSGNLDLDDLRSKISENTSGIFIENPSYLGIIETQGEEIAKIAHDNGALFVVYAEPSSLGILEAPVNYGADIVCGDIQSLGMHMGYGSGHAGYIATKNKPEYIMNYPTHFYSLYENENGELGFSRSLNQRTSYGSRENAVEYLGTNSGLWAITAAVYLSLMGPKGMCDLGKDMVCKMNYFKKRLSEINSVKLKFNSGANFNEVVVDFKDSGKQAEVINEMLLEKGIIGGKILTHDMDGFTDCVLYCITELTKKSDIDLVCKYIRQIIE